MDSLKLLGCKGTTGTQASFYELFDGDHEKIDKIDGMIARKMGFENCVAVSGQTYSRKVDTRVLNVLAGIAASANEAAPVAINDFFIIFSPPHFVDINFIFIVKRYV